MSKAIRWSDEQLRDYEAKLGRPLKRATPKAERVEEPKRKGKYNATKVEVDGILFDSKKEAHRWTVLKLKVKHGEIDYLFRQVTFELAPAVHMEGNKRKTPALRYTADFLWIKDGKVTVEDVKGMKTRAYLQKKHLMKTIHGIDILET